MTPAVAVVDTGAFNRASLTAALERAGARVVCTASIREAGLADAFVLPGVANFGYIARRLQQNALDDAIRSMISSGMPGLAICAGFQILCRESEESPGVAGLGVLDACVRRFNGEKRQHAGWTRVSPCREEDAVVEGWAYFGHGFAVRDRLSETVATSTFDGSFVSVVRTGRVLGVQFHPERSGAYGRKFLAQFIERARGAYAG